MAEQWIIRVQGKDYGPADVETLHEWKADGRVLPVNPARRSDVELWQTAAEIPGLFQIELPAVQQRVEARVPRPDFVADTAAAATSKPQTRNVLTETFRIYFRGFFKFFGLSLLSIVPIVCAELTSRFIDTAPGVDLDLRTLVAAGFGFCMIVLRLVLLPVYIAGIQILSVELATGNPIGFLSVLNNAVKYWPRVAGLCIFVYGVFVLIIGFGILVLSMTLVASMSGSVFWIVVALGLTTLQLWCFCRFFTYTLFWQQFAVLDNLPAVDSLRQSSNLAHSGATLPWYQRPLWRAAIIVSVWLAFLIGAGLVILWPRIVAEWQIAQDYLNQLMQSQDPQAIFQKINASVQTSHPLDLRALILSIVDRALQPLLGIAFVVLYLDSKRGAE